jgi:transcriptional regulator with XRE-family HTH domain
MSQPRVALGGNKVVARIGQRTTQRRRTYFKEWRAARGMTQEQLAKALGVDKSAVSKVETGRNLYNQSTLEAWADALGCEPGDLISRAPEVIDPTQFAGMSPELIKSIVALVKAHSR